MSLTAQITLKTFHNPTPEGSTRTMRNLLLESVLVVGGIIADPFLFYLDSPECV